MSERLFPGEFPHATPWYPSELRDHHLGAYVERLMVERKLLRPSLQECDKGEEAEGEPES